eukprot:gene10399-21684_t
MQSTNSAIGKTQRGQPGVVCTQSRNHTTRPLSRLWLATEKYRVHKPKHYFVFGANRNSQLWKNTNGGTKRNGDNRESNPGPSAPKAEIIPLDHYPVRANSRFRYRVKVNKPLAGHNRNFSSERATLDNPENSTSKSDSHNNTQIQYEQNQNILPNDKPNPIKKVYKVVIKPPKISKVDKLWPIPSATLFKTQNDIPTSESSSTISPNPSLSINNNLNQPVTKSVWKPASSKIPPPTSSSLLTTETTTQLSTSTATSISSISSPSTTLNDDTIKIAPISNTTNSANNTTDNTHDVMQPTTTSLNNNISPSYSTSNSTSIPSAAVSSKYNRLQPTSLTPSNIFIDTIHTDTATDIKTTLSNMSESSTSTSTNVQTSGRPVENKVYLYKYKTNQSQSQSQSPSVSTSVFTSSNSHSTSMNTAKRSSSVSSFTSLLQRVKENTPAVNNSTPVIKTTTSSVVSSGASDPTSVDSIKTSSSSTTPAVNSTSTSTLKVSPSIMTTESPLLSSTPSTTTTATIPSTIPLTPTSTPSTTPSTTTPVSTSCTPVSTTSSIPNSIPSLGKSVRDALQEAERKKSLKLSFMSPNNPDSIRNKYNISNNNNYINNNGSSESKIHSPSENIFKKTSNTHIKSKIDTVAAAMSETDVDTDVDINPEEDTIPGLITNNTMNEINANEIRFERKVVHLIKKKEEFAKKVLDPEAIRNKWAKGPNNTSKHQHQQRHVPYASTNWKPQTLSDIISGNNTNSNDSNSSSTGYNRYNNKYDSNQNTSSSTSTSKGTVVKEVSIPAVGLTVRDLASKLSMKVTDLHKKLTDIGEDINTKNIQVEDHIVEADVAELLVLELGIIVKREKDLHEEHAGPSKLQGQDLRPRAPLVCVMGHVDHGKTTLLDKLRKANVAASEAGGITQKLSAFSVETGGRSVVFLDTPGHAAFSSMRVHGANATDIVVLVVAIDDGIRPQTVEALKTAQLAGCPIIIALNKIDKIKNPSDRIHARSRVLNQLLEFNLIAEDFGGEVQVAEVSAVSGEGLDSLTESLLLQADIMELTAAIVGQAEATVLEGCIEKGRGVVVDILMKWGTLNIGDFVIIGTTFGRIKTMSDDRGKNIKKALPSMPVRITGLKGIPVAGMELLSVDSETKAKQITARRERVQELKASLVTSTSTSGTANSTSGINVTSNGNSTGNDSTSSGTGTSTNTSSNGGNNNNNTVALDVLLKADGIGSLEALKSLVNNLASRTKDVIVRIIGSSLGDVTRSDIDLANSSDGALILGFNIGIVDAGTRSAAKEHDIRIMRDTVIYRLEDELKATMLSMMPRLRILHLEGTAKVLKVFVLNSKSPTTVAGTSVLTGSLKSGHNMVYVHKRDGDVIKEDIPVVELKRFKDTVNE